MERMRYLVILLIFFGCSEEEVPLLDVKELEETLELHDISTRKTRNNCLRDDWHKVKTKADRYDYETFYVVYHKRDDNGNWHNPVGGYARTVYDYNDNVLSVSSYNDQINEDVVQRVKGKEIRYIAAATFYDGVAKYKHKRDAKYHGLRYHIDIATGDTICKGEWECNKLIKGDYCE